MSGWKSAETKHKGVSSRSSLIHTNLFRETSSSLNVKPGLVTERDLNVPVGTRLSTHVLYDSVLCACVRACGGGQSWGLSVHRWGTDRVVSEHFLTPSLLFICLLMASTSPSANQTIDLIRAGSPFHSEDGSMLASCSGGSAHLNITVNELPASHTWGGVYLLSSHQVKNLKWEINWTYLR